ncbi:hypothetical protein LAZ67_18001831 [Cordylochernes scorpioides]|uniref:Uncharacterized protein n=1 Tax=Cordylochernes scorpioides TaxID=51811 RepID=A0ABY6LI99_9ARAC|nr:hypothetical protein LAZ67_18001831 [Cordylochernes scorpioides]
MKDRTERENMTNVHQLEIYLLPSIQDSAICIQLMRSWRHLEGVAHLNTRGTIFCFEFPLVRLIKPISRTGFNVTSDNWFSSIHLANDLMNEHKLIKKKFLTNSSVKIMSFIQACLAFTKIQLFYHMQPKYLAVMVLATMHNDASIESKNILESSK